MICRFSAQVGTTLRETIPALGGEHYPLQKGRLARRNEKHI